MHDRPITTKTIFFGFCYRRLSSPPLPLKPGHPFLQERVAVRLFGSFIVLWLRVQRSNALCFFSSGHSVALKDVRVKKLRVSQINFGPPHQYFGCPRCCSMHAPAPYTCMSHKTRHKKNATPGFFVAVISLSLQHFSTSGQCLSQLQNFIHTKHTTPVTCNMYMWETSNTSRRLRRCLVR